MSLATVDLPSDPDELRAFAQALQERLATVEKARVTTIAELASTAAKLRAAKATIHLTALEIERLKAPAGGAATRSFVLWSSHGNDSGRTRQGY